MDRDAFTIFVITGSRTSNEPQTTLVGNKSNTQDFLAEALISSHTFNSLRLPKQRNTSSVISETFPSGGTRLRRTQADGISILTNVLYLAYKEFSDIICKHSLVKVDRKVQNIRCAKQFFVCAEKLSLNGSIILYKFGIKLFPCLVHEVSNLIPLPRSSPFSFSFPA